VRFCRLQVPLENDSISCSTSVGEIDTAIYFMVGAAIAATFNTTVDPQIILPLALDPTLPTISVMAIALVQPA
jgi:hypothetical protein